MGLLREDGYLRFSGRYKDMRKVGGENVDPMEVESFLMEHPGVHQVAIVGFPDERLGEVGVAFVQPRLVIPMHYDTWDMIAADPEEFRRLVGDSAEVVILAPGESHTLS